MSNTSKENIINIIIDANFILLPIQFRIDYLDEINLALEGRKRFIIFKQVLDELNAKKHRESNKVKFQKEFDTGLHYLNINKAKYPIDFRDDVKEKTETTDAFLLRRAIELKPSCSHIFLATNDYLLRKEARKKKISLIFLRQKKYLSIERS